MSNATLGKEQQPQTTKVADLEMSIEIEKSKVSVLQTIQIHTN